MLFLIVATLLLAAAIGFYVGQGDNGQLVPTQLTNHKSNSERAAAPPACEPRGQYGHVPPGKAHKQCEEKPPPNSKGGGKGP